jgi:carboxypeptidase family protein/TonB-dependent receptor-like protein
MLRASRAALFAVGAVLVLKTLSPGGLSAQEITGTISGTLTDSTGAVIPDATVTVTNLSTKAQRSTTTTSAGVFFFTSLPIGDYELKATKEGFKQYQRTMIHLDVNDKLSFDIALEVGVATQQITVTGETSPLETSTGMVSNLVGSEQTQALPLNGRAFNQLVDLVPGVAPDSGRVGGGVGLFSDTAVSVNGNQSNSNTFLVDGVYNEDNGSNANLLVTPSVDSLAEFNILRNNYSAEFGGGTGAIVNVITKSGSQTFHGDLFDFLRNDALDSANFFENATGTRKSKLRLNNFGGTIGGPFWIPGHYNQDKTKDFFFVSTELRREIRGNVAHDNVPSFRQRQGILDPDCVSTPAPCTVQAADPFEVPLSGEANVDPSLIDPNGAAILMRYPLPNANFVQNGFNYLANEPTVTNVDQETYRWDHYVSEKARVMVRYMGMSQNLNDINEQLWGDDNFPSVNSDWKWVGRNAVLHITDTLSPRLVNDFEAGYSHNHISFLTGRTSDKVLASRAGFTYTELFPETNGSFPTMWGVENFGAVLHTAPFFNKTDNWLFKDDLAFTFGKHNVKAGGDFLLLRKMEPANGGDDEDAGTVIFNSFQDLLLGNLLTYQEEQTLNPVRGRYKDFAFYGQDDYKATRSLTLNLGLRWQYLSPIRAANRNIANFDPGLYDSAQCSPAAFTPDGLVDPTLCNLLNGIITPASTGGVDKALVRRHFNTWEPRIGMAWRPFAGNDKFVFRGGVGVYHGRDAGSQTSALGRQPPFDRVATLNNITFSQLAPGKLSPFNPDLPQPPVEISALDIAYFSPESYQYSTGLQWEFLPKTTVEIDYVGSRQVHLGRNRDINQVAPQFQAPVFNGLDPNTVRPFLGYSIINLNERAGDSRYNSLQVFVNHRVDRYGLQLQAAYTYSRTIASANNQDSEGHARPIQDAYHPQLNKAVAVQNQPNSLVFNYLWSLPFFRDAQGWKGELLDGWQLIGITAFRTGLPLTVCEDRDIDGTLSEACQRPNLVGNPRLSKSARNLDRYFNTSAYVLQEPGTFGNAGLNMFTGPGINNWDFSIFKNFRVPWFGKGSSSLGSESATLQFRAEFFNLFNHTQFSDVNTTFVPQTDANGNLLVGQPPDPSSGVGSVTGARAPREIQFALKFIF